MTTIDDKIFTDMRAQSDAALLARKDQPTVADLEWAKLSDTEKARRTRIDALNRRVRQEELSLDLLLNYDCTNSQLAASEQHILFSDTLRATPHTADRAIVVQEKIANLAARGAVPGFFRKLFAPAATLQQQAATVIAAANEEARRALAIQTRHDDLKLAVQAARADLQQARSLRDSLAEQIAMLDEPEAVTARFMREASRGSSTIFDSAANINFHRLQLAAAAAEFPRVEAVLNARLAKLEAELAEITAQIPKE